MRLVSVVLAVSLMLGCRGVQVVPISRDFCRPRPVLLVGRSEAIAQLSAALQLKLGAAYPVVLAPLETEHLTVTVVEYDYRENSKQVEQVVASMGAFRGVASPYITKYEPEASVLLRVQSGSSTREYLGSSTGVLFLPSERPGVTKEEFLDDATRGAVRQLAADMAACEK